MYSKGGAHMSELLAAEQKASAIIAEARSARTERMKNAKREAQILIDSFRNEKEAAFQANLAKTKGSTGSESENLKMQTDAEIEKMQKDFEANKERVIGMLVHSVCTVTYAVPEGRKRNMV